MMICDLCEVKTRAMSRDIPFAEFPSDMCDEHWKEFQEAIKLATSIFRGSAITEKDWASFKSRLMASRNVKH